MVRQRKARFIPPTQHLYEKQLACTHVEVCSKCALGFHQLHTEVETLKAALAALGQGGSANG